MTNNILCIIFCATNQPKVNKMAKKKKQNYEFSEGCYDLDNVGKMHVSNGGYEDESGKTCVCLSVFQKHKSESCLQSDVAFAEYSLKELGFKDIITDGETDGVDGIMAMANMVIEYDINKKPYTITNADVQEMKSLQEVIECSKPNVRIYRDEPKFKQVRAAEFKRAIANYIAQNQK